MAETPQFQDLQIKIISKSNKKKAKILHFTLTSPSFVSTYSNESKDTNPLLKNEFLKAGKYQFLLSSSINLPLIIEAISIFDKQYTNKVNIPH